MSIEWVGNVSVWVGGLIAKVGECCWNRQRIGKLEGGGAIPYIDLLEITRDGIRNLGLKYL